jgi:surfeit locus 1 family protein
MRSGKNEPLQPIEDPDFVSIVDAPAKIVRARRRHGPGLILLGVYTHIHLFSAALLVFVSC